MSAAAARMGWWGAAALATLLAAPPVLGQTADWKQDWDRTVAAAEKEGELIVSGPVGTLWSGFLTRKFQEDFPRIRLKMTPFSGRDFWPRFSKEREIGQYLWDLRIGGTDPSLWALKKQGAFAETRSLLVLPEVADDNAWYGGIDGLFGDIEKRSLLGFAFYMHVHGYYDRAAIPQGLTATDLVKPEWTGKISMDDPRGGSGFNALAVLLKTYGEDFVRTLLITQKPVIPGNKRQQMEWLVSGRYPIAFGMIVEDLVAYGNTGDRFVPIGGALSWTQGFGGIALIANAPHPNAAKVFINWLLTKDVQGPLMQVIKTNSRRKDVAPGDPESVVDPARLGELVGDQGEIMNPYHARTAALVREMPR
ncbi:MAG: ABC transporter substrate-binding protein [Gemmatimonas sp.]